MGFFKWLGGGTPEEKEAKAELERKIQATREAELARREKDQDLLQRGGIPSEATARLLELGQHAGQDNAIFTSNLAPDELALLRLHGFRPRGLVTGSAVWHVGQAFVFLKDCEIKELSRAYDQATSLAVSRLKQERDLIGAQGVVGVRLSIVRHEWSEKMIEVQVVGTAVEAPEALRGQTWLSDLSGQEWWALHSSGFDAIDLVWGYCNWFLYTTVSDDMIIRGWSNVECAHWSEGLTRARNVALLNMRKQALAGHADGIAGVTIERKLSRMRVTTNSSSSGAGAMERMHHNLKISIIGTAVRDRRDGSQKPRRTVNVLSLRDGQMKPAVLEDGRITTKGLSRSDVTLYD